jgi:cytoskeletal protein RodZ
MNTTIDLDALVIDGMKLRQAREERGLSVAEVAVLCTLSREQVQHIEDGGVRPFYTPAHKLLAIRKYAVTMGIPYDDIVIGPGADDTMPVPADAPASLMVHGEGEQATDLRLAAVERNAELRRKILIGAVTLTIVLAFYAKMRGTPDTLPVTPPPSVSGATDGDKSEAEVAEPPKPAAVNSATPASTPSLTPSSSTNAAAASVTAAAAPASAASAEASSPVLAPAAPAATSTSAVAASPAAASAKGGAPATAPPADTKASTDAKLADNGERCTAQVGGDVKTWTPSYQRKADTRLFLVSPKETTVCVQDASGKTVLLKLKARAGQAWSGKPPYLVQSPLLPELEIYLQGMRARVPAQAPALRLQATPLTSAPSEG